MALNYTIVDIETTGTNPHRHEVTEISLIRYSDRHQLSKNLKCLTPWTADPIALKITNKTKSDLYKGEHPKDVIHRIKEWVDEDGSSPEHRCFVAHSAPFDAGRLHKLWAQHGEETFPCLYWFNTLTASRALGKKIGSPAKEWKLKTAMVNLGLTPIDGMDHSAAGDTRNTYMLFKKLKESELDYLQYIKPIPYSLKSKDPAANLDDL